MATVPLAEDQEVRKSPKLRAPRPEVKCREILRRCGNPLNQTVKLIEERDRGTVTARQAPVRRRLRLFEGVRMNPDQPCVNAIIGHGAPAAPRPTEPAGQHRCQSARAAARSLRARLPRPVHPRDRRCSRGARPPTRHGPPEEVRELVSEAPPGQSWPDYNAARPAGGPRPHRTD